MHIRETGDRDVFEIRQSRLSVVLFGVAFSALGVVTASRGGGSWVGVVFVGVGLVMALGRRGTLINRREGTITTWWGLLFSWHRSRQPLAAYEEVRLSKELRRSSGGRGTARTVYCIRLSGEAAKGIKVGESARHEEARSAAEAVAKRMAFPLVDSSSGKTVVRKPELLDESIRQQTKLKRKRYKLPDAPSEMKTSVTAEQDKIVLGIPPRTLKSEACGLLVISVVIGAVFWPFQVAMFSKPGMSESLGLGWLLLHVIPTAVGFPGLFLLGLWNALSRTEVTVTPVSLEARRRFLLSTHRTLPADEIEELVLKSKGREGLEVPVVGFRVGPHKGIIAKSDRATISFGGHLSVPEQKYLYVLIHRMLTI